MLTVAKAAAVKQDNKLVLKCPDASDTLKFSKY